MYAFVVLQLQLLYKLHDRFVRIGNDLIHKVQQDSCHKPLQHLLYVYSVHTPALAVTESAGYLYFIYTTVYAVMSRA
jgi:hypothetical protein